jgi:hypothetical protein
MKKGLLAMSIIALSSITLLAQNEIDALRFSQDAPLGTARFSAMSGAFGSLGGEFSALSLTLQELECISFLNLALPQVST